MSRDVDNAYLANTVVDIHTASRGSYGRPRLHAELRLGMGITVSRKRVGGLLPLVGRAGIGGNTHRKRRNRPLPAPHDDRVQRQFVADGPEPAVVHRHHRIPHRDRPGLLLRRVRRLQPRERWLVHR